MVRINKTINCLGHRPIKANIEMYESGQELVDVSKSRPVLWRDRSVAVCERTSMSRDFEGVATFDEALDLLANGYQPTVDKLKEEEKHIDIRGQGKRFTFRNDVVGYNPVVPLFLQGVPNCMVNTTMKPIKTKVLDIYYDIGAVGDVSPEDIIKSGQTLLAAIMELEMQGYRFNLYITKSQYSCGDTSTDMLFIKIKNANTPLDLRRMSFPLSHPAFQRCITFDWYEKVPGGKPRSGYGHSLAYDYTSEEMERAMEELLGRKCLFIARKYTLDKGKEYIKSLLTNKSTGKKC